MKINLNFNAYVELKVTDRGRQIWQNYLDEFPWEKVPSLKKPETSNVWRGQLHDACRIFGAAMILGFDPVEANFIYESENQKAEGIPTPPAASS